MQGTHNLDAWFHELLNIFILRRFNKSELYSEVHVSNQCMCFLALKSFAEDRQPPGKHVVMTAVEFKATGLRFAWIDLPRLASSHREINDTPAQTLTTLLSTHLCLHVLQWHKPRNETGGHSTDLQLFHSACSRQMHHQNTQRDSGRTKYVLGARTAYVFKAMCIHP